MVSEVCVCVCVLQEGINVCSLGVYAIFWYNVVPCGLDEGFGGGVL